MAAKPPQADENNGRLHLLGAIVDASRDAIWSWTSDGTITSWNREAERLLGYAAADIIGKPLLVLVPPERMELAEEAMDKLRAGNWFGQYETFRLKKDGTRVQVELTVSPLRDADKNIIGAATVCRDITQRKQSEETLARRVNELATLYTFTNRLNHATSLDDIYRAGLDAMSSALHCQRASILMFDDAKVMRFVAWRGLSDRYRAKVDGHSPWTADSTDPSPICIGDIEQSGESEELKAAIKREGIRSLAFIPLIASGRLIGKFMTYYEAPHRFSEAETELSLTIARQAAFGVEQKRAQDAEKTLTRELQHRTNNLLTVVRAIAHRSLTTKSTLDEARETFDARLQALARAHLQLMKSNWTGLSIGEIVRLELEPFGARAKVRGGDVRLGVQYAQNLSLVLHELATNATKYGALSSPAGTVDVNWAVDRNAKQPILRFQWREQGGPPVTQPQRQGFGTSLLQGAFAQSRIDYAPKGVNYEFALPIGSIEAELAG
jgi:PAS domain S-box-containing protein